MPKHKEITMKTKENNPEEAPMEENLEKEVPLNYPVDPTIPSLPQNPQEPAPNEEKGKGPIDPTVTHPIVADSQPVENTDQKV